MTHETVLSSRRIYDGRILNLRVDDVRTASGIETIREIVEHGGAVAMVAVDEDDRIVLVKQYRHAVGRVTLEVPAGTLEADEDPAVCAARELSEETGHIAAQLERIGGIYPSPGFSTEYIHLFVATHLTQADAHPEEDEAIEIELLPWSEVLDRILSGVIEDSKSVSALLMFDARRRLS